MKLAEIVQGNVYVDTNVLYMYLRADPLHLADIEHFLTRVVRGELTAYVSLLVVDELFYRLLLALIKERPGHNPLNVLREDLPGAIADGPSWPHAPANGGSAWRCGRRCEWRMANGEW